MLKRFDHIIKNALENYVAPYAPDWAVFYDLLLAEQNAPADDGQLEDQGYGEMLDDLTYAGSAPAWSAFESRIDNLNIELDQEFDQTIGDNLAHLPESMWGTSNWDIMSSRLDALDTELDQEFDQTVGDALTLIPETMWGAGHWNMISSRIDDLNMEMDQEFDRTIGDAMVSLPESTWKEGHWEMLSSRLDVLNDRPRLIMIKVIEAAAILLLLIQLTNLYSDYQREHHPENDLSTYLEQFSNSDKDIDQNQGDDLIQAPNSLSSGDEKESERYTGEKMDQNVPSEKNNNQIIPGNNVEIAQGNQDNTNSSFTNNASQVDGGRLTKESRLVMELPTDRHNQISYGYLEDLAGHTHDQIEKDISGVTPQLSNLPQLINYDDRLRAINTTSPRLDVRDISLLTTMSPDSILNSIPVFQVITPRIHSSLETGILADATNVVVDDYFASSQQPYKIPTFNAGVYFRYKIQYKDMFGSLGGDYVYMKEGSHNINKLSMVTLPLEFGYNVVNLPALRMYFSGGVAGRFVPVADYSTKEYSQSSEGNSKSNKPSNGLLHNGPFEINSYLSGRLSVGFDINVNKKTSINLRFSHDIWLKGRGIGYNLDKFNSNHIAIGTNFHL